MTSMGATDWMGRLPGRQIQLNELLRSGGELIPKVDVTESR